nr:immunoglobulin heavy chain junction region [Macaca mulatta]MOW76011.1 immunoglobulin heavy chain junction region [Macaca mulatta]MOW76102.1 immunoglobulin heavy chain junction region [Macaca mulatta]MOW76326.1 immunoglobulin heavy chain junction region [Macaca mulatta]MOW76451.1 immunoglobulin heavy chain junction region [Macaca mulatta]
CARGGIAATGPDSW